MCTQMACTLHLLRFIILSPLKTRLLEAGTLLSTPICTWWDPEKIETLESCRAKACVLVQGLQPQVWQPPSNGHRGCQCRSTSDLMLCTSHLSVSVEENYSAPSRKWRKKSYKDDCKLISQQTLNNELLRVVHHSYLSWSLFYWILKNRE